MMKKYSMRKLLSVIGCMVLIAALALGFIGCSSDNPPAETSPAGEKSFVFVVVDGSGNETSFDITSSKATVGEALLDGGYIAGEESEYGLYVKTVNGITADYDVDGTYWGFYIDGEYATSGVDTTEIVDGATYSFRVEGAAPAEEPAGKADVTVLGEGAAMFYFTAVDLDGKETKFEIHTDAATVGEALLAHGLIEGDPGDYGLYVKTVNGLTLDWDKDGKYWSLLVDGEYAMTGVDMTEIVNGTTYTFVPA